MANIIINVALLSVCIACVNGQTDNTIVVGAKGPAVVETTCDKIISSCVFPDDDKLLTRRLAFVESLDGNDSKTFRAGYYGGIWQVDADMFDVTQSPPALLYLQSILSNISKNFSIEWRSVKWEDLTRPLYSAIAARLYMQYNSRINNTKIPQSISDQAQFWVRYYRPELPARQYISLVEDLRKQQQGCLSNTGSDVMFVLDASGSIGATNFDKMKAFVQGVVSYFDIGPGEEQYRFGLLSFSETVRTEFYLNAYNNTNDTMAAIGRVVYTMGGTNTDLALDELNYRSFTAIRGSRMMGMFNYTAIY